MAVILLLAFLLPFGFFTGPLIALLGIGWVLSGGWKEKWERLRTAKFLWLWITFYAWNLLSLAWSANLPEGLFDVQVKLAMLICPLVLATIRFDTKQTWRVLGAFVAGLVACGLFMLLRSTWLYVTQDVNTFYYQEFAGGLIHPGYLSMYYCVGIMTLFHGVLLQSFPARPWKISAIALCLFFAIIVFLLSSKMGLLTMVLLFAGYIVYAVIRFRRYVVGAAALVVLVAGFFVAFRLFPQVAARVDNLTKLFSAGQPIDPAEAESNQVRVLIWKADYAIVARHPWAGVGIGDVQDTLTGEYRARGMTGALEKKLNAHSQLFQTGIATGLVGMLLLAALVLLPAFRDRLGFSVLFALLFLLNIIPESRLEVQAGVIFFGFFYSLILFSVDRRCLAPLEAPSPVSFL